MRSLTAGSARPGAPALVLVPGLGALGYLVPLVRACAGWTSVHLLDLPGSGHRTTARLPAELAPVAEVLHGWLAQVAGAPVALLGHSTGAQVALRAALAAPDRVGHLVLGGATFDPGSRRVAPLVGRVLRTLRHEQPGELPAVLPYYLRGRRGLPRLLASALRDAPEEVVGALQVPLLVLRGRHDHLCPEPWATALATRAPRGRLVTLPGGHNAPWTVPDLTAQVLRDALVAQDGVTPRR